jgi:signal transduction histidine kinase
MTDPIFVPPTHARILIVDDNHAIHDDFKKVLAVEDNSALAALEDELFGEEATPASAPPTKSTKRMSFEFESAFQGVEALELVKKSVAENKPYSLAFVDVRMPPGWDGIETIAHLWEVDPALQVVLCTAYSDYDWTGITEKIDAADRLVILKKPFDNIEVLQLAHSMSHKWSLSRALHGRLADLEARVRERTRALEDANEGLRREAALRAQAEGKLRLMEKLEAVGQLAAGLAHEINTPMGVITNNLGFLEESMTTLISFADRDVTAPADRKEIDYLKDESPRVLHDTKVAAARVAGIVKVAREFARPEETVAVRANLCAALRATVEVAKATHRDVAELQLECGDEIPDVVCHVSSVNQVVHELIDNAAHSISEAKRTSGAIHVAVKPDGKDVVIAVRDNGAGIKHEHQSSVFNPFFTTRQVGKGMGRGLSTAHLVVVDQHGGRIHFETVPGQGTTFFVRLPIDGPRVGSAA